MKKTVYLVAITLFFAQMGWAQPQYESAKTQEVIEKMIKAHGGMEAWSNLETLSFTTVMHSESLGFLRFWLHSQTIDMQTRRSYQDWPLVGSKLSYDGQQVFTEDWRVGNPPNHQHSVFFYYVNLPWLTQDKNVALGAVERTKHQAFKNEVFKVEMSFTEVPTLGKSPKDTFTLYIDTETYLLNGYEYTVGYGPLLDIMQIPASQETFGPVLRINNYTGDVNGLKFPMLMTTHSADLSQQYGDHAVYNFKLNEAFDESRMTPGAKAVVDKQQDIRKGVN